jgi:hypothetical protein
MDSNFIVYLSDDIIGGGPTYTIAATAAIPIWLDPAKRKYFDPWLKRTTSCESLTGFNPNRLIPLRKYACI